MVVGFDPGTDEPALHRLVFSQQCPNPEAPITSKPLEAPLGDLMQKFFFITKDLC
jgi:hypothetical protein